MLFKDEIYKKNKNSNLVFPKLNGFMFLFVLLCSRNRAQHDSKIAKVLKDVP